MTSPKDPVPRPLVNAHWLYSNGTNTDLRIVDGSWHLPTLGRDPLQEFFDKHIPGSVFFDIDKIADTKNSLPHMVPTENDFARHIGALGINNQHHVIAYDSTGIGSAARVWWMFRLFGHEKVSVLDGGLPAWEQLGEAASGTVLPQKETFKAKLAPKLIRSIHQIKRNLETTAEKVLDARSRGRFEGVEAEPRKGLKSGRIPKSFNLPYTEVYDSKTKLFLSADKLSKLFSSTGIDPDASIVTSCGSGVTACNLALALYLTGNRDAAVYDGSWTEWASSTGAPIE